MSVESSSEFSLKVQVNFKVNNPEFHFISHKISHGEFIFAFNFFDMMILYSKSELNVSGKMKDADIT